MNNTNENKPQLLTINLAEVKYPQINASQLKRSKDSWVNYGDKNGFPDYLIEAVNKSTIHQSFIKKRQQLIKSGGLTYTDNVAPFLENINEDGETVNQLLRDIAVDLSILETFAVIVRYNKFRDKVVAFDYVDSSKYRCEKELDERGRVKGYWLCPDWTNVRDNTPQYFERFNPYDKNKATTQLYVFHNRHLGQPYIPNISYASALHFIELHYELSKYALNTVYNGFFGSVVISISGNYTEEQQKTIGRQIESRFKGSENAAKIMVNFSEQSGNLTITPLSNHDNTPLLVALRDICIAEIASAHQGNPIVAGITPNGSTLGSDGKLYRDSLEAYYNTVIIELQAPFIEFIERVLKFNGYTDFELSIASTAQLSNSLDLETIKEFIKPERWVTDYGFEPDDIIDSMRTDSISEPEIEEELPEEDTEIGE